MRPTRKKTKICEPEAVPRGAKSRVDLLTSEPIEMKHLKSAISLLTHACNEKTKRKTVHCVNRSSNCDTKTRPKDFGISLRSREPLVIAQHIRSAILQHDWETAAQLLHFFISTGVKDQTSFIARACMVILMNHPYCDSELIFNFIRDVTLYDNDEDLEKYAILMHTLREKTLQPIPPSNGDLRKRLWKLIEATELTSIELNVPLFKKKYDNEFT